MTNKDTTVVICSAGMGTRLGIGTTKALMHIDGKPLIIHQLEALKEFDDIRIVLGYQAEKVIEVVNKFRKDIMFAFNYDYKSTGPAASLSKGLINAKKYILSIDGDILVNPFDFREILEREGEYLAISNKHSSEPILIEVENQEAIHFSKRGNYEWPGVVKFERNRFKKSEGYIYDVIEELLPMPIVLLRSRDIDTPEDYENAISWVECGYNE